jgi:hypothetical protein
MGEVKNSKRVNGVSVLERVHLSYCTNLTLEVSISSTYGSLLSSY